MNSDAAGIQPPEDNPATSQDDPGQGGGSDDGARVLSVNFPHGRFIPGETDDGVALPEIDAEGVLVPGDQVSVIKSKAKSAGVSISARKE